MALAMRRLLCTPAGARPLSALAASADFPSYVLKAPATESSSLANGMRVATETGAGEAATVGVWVDAGSRHETAANSGSASFLGHMSLQGTNNRTRAQLTADIEGMGGHLTAHTDRERTLYSATVGKGDVAKAVEVLSDVLLNPKLDGVEGERGAVLAEMNATQTAAQVQDLLHDTAFGGAGLGRNAAGSADSVARLTKGDLETFAKENHTASRMVLAGSGAVNHEQLVDLASQHFGGVARGSAAPTGSDRFCGSDIRVREDHMPLAHFAIGFEAPGASSPHAFPLMLMQTMLGSWDRTQSGGKNFASKLASAVAEDELCHSYSTFNTSYGHTGLFGVQAVCEGTTVQDFSWHMMDAFVSLCHIVTEEEVARAQTQLKAQLSRDLNGSAAKCEDIARQFTHFGRRMSPAEVFMRIDDIDVAAVQATAEAVIHDSELALAAVGPVHELPDYNWFRRRTFWLRY